MTIPSKDKNQTRHLKIASLWSVSSYFQWGDRSPYRLKKWELLTLHKILGVLITATEDIYGIIYISKQGWEEGSSCDHLRLLNEKIILNEVLDAFRVVIIVVRATHYEATLLIGKM